MCDQQSVHFRPNIPCGKLKHQPSLGGILDG
ncbi:Uncharacterised protein [Vibrio cholerae]|nr:Uncharacterised protein [Vibrio cholerae]CSI81575.1 Uncharacterised protein [Vibrio cholerae]